MAHAEGQQPRPYQQAFIDLVEREECNYIIPLPTGAGKTLIAIHWARAAVALHPRRCVVCRRALISSSMELRRIVLLNSSVLLETVSCFAAGAVPCALTYQVFVVPTVPLLTQQADV